MKISRLLFSIFGLGLILFLSWRLGLNQTPVAHASGPDVLITLDEAGSLFIKDGNRAETLTLAIDGPTQTVIIASPSPTLDAICRGVSCDTSGQSQVRLPLAAIAGDIYFILGSGDDQLVLAPPNTNEITSLTMIYDGNQSSVTVNTTDNLNLASVDIAGPLTINLAGDEAKTLTAGPLTARNIRISGSDKDDRLIFNGPLNSTQDVVISIRGRVTINAPVDAPSGFVSTSYSFTLMGGTVDVTAGAATLRAEDELRIEESQLYVAGDLGLLAHNKVYIRDSETQPFIAQTGGKLSLQGNQAVDIFALRHPHSALISGGDMMLRSENAVRGDIHYFTGGKFEIEQPDGRPGDLTSPYDPIVFANGDVSLGDYTGASLHVLAGGSVTLSNVDITGPDASANSINPRNTDPFNGVDTIASLADVTLSNGTAGLIDGSITPTLDIRAGIDWNTFAGGPPADQVIPPGAVTPNFGGAATSADITVTGNITISAPAGQVLLTNQYRPNNLIGDISTGDIDASTTQRQANGGSIAVDSRGDITTGHLFTFADVAGTLVTAGNAGNIGLLAFNGAIVTSGDLSAFSRTPVNSSGPAGNGGFIVAVAANGISIANGTGAVETYASSNGDGSAGNGAPIGLETLNGDINVGYLRSYARAFQFDVGMAGDVFLQASTGMVSIGSDFFASINASALGDTPDGGGTVTILADSGIDVAAQILTNVSGFDGNAGDIILLNLNGDITTGALLAAATAGSGGSPGNGGSVDVETMVGRITTGDVTAFSNAFFINNDARDGGEILIKASGDIKTGGLETYSEARGAQGDAGLGGNISLEATNGSITSSGNLLAYSLSAINNGASASAQNSGDVRLQALNNISITGRIDAFSEAGVFGNAVVTGTASNGGTVALTTTTGSILIADNISSYANAELDAGNGGPISLKAGTGIEINNGAGLLNAYSRSTEGSVANGGNVNLNTTSGDVILAKIDASASNTFATGSTGSGGAITINTGNGLITLSGDFFQALNASASGPGPIGNGGDITLTATQGISAAAQILARAFGINGNGGNISLLTTGGDIIASDLIDASAIHNSSTPGDGGNITLQTLQGNITTNDLNTHSLALLINNDSGNGGDISIQAANGTVTTGQLQSYSEARGLQGDTGNGGPVEIIAGNGGINVGGDVSSYSLASINNNNSGLAADGGDILLQTTGIISISGRLRPFSAATGPNGQASASGDVNLVAGSDIELSYIDARAVGVAANGQGGTVEVTTGQFFRATDIIANALFNFNSNATISTVGLPNTSAITITHGGNGITPFIVGDATTNGTIGPLNSGDASINPTQSFFFNHFEAPNIWIISVPVSPAISKSANPNTDVTFQGEVTYTVVLANDDVLDATGMLVTDTLPSEVDFARWVVQPPGANVAADEITWTGTVPAGGEVTFVFVVNHVGSLGDVFTNTAEFFQPSTGLAGSDVALVTIEGAAPLLTISKTANPNTNVPFGSEVTYTILLNNNGLGDANDTLFMDTLPGEVIFARWIQQPAGASVNGNVIDWTGTVTAGETINFTFVVSHTGNFGDVFTNTAQFFHLGTNTFGDDSAAVTILDPPVLSIVKTADPNTNVTNQGQVTYTIVVDNSGPSDAIDTVFTDTLPTEVDFARWVQQPVGASVIADVVAWNGTVPANGDITFSFVVSHTGDFSDTVVNTAEYSHFTSSGTSEAVFTVEPRTTDLFIGKSSVRNQETGIITYTVVVQNLGSNDADGTVVTDPIPAGISTFNWQCTPSSGASCTANGTGAVNDTLTTFPVGGQVVYTIIATLVSTDATIVNIATVDSPPGVINTAPTNSAINTSAPASIIYLPVIFNTFFEAPVPPPSPPDLIIETLVATSNAITVEVRNVGGSPVIDAFWVDVYIDPDPPPTGVNQPWQDLSDEGLAWGVKDQGLPLDPNEVLTLTLTSEFLVPSETNFNPPLEPGTPVWAQVDSINFDTTYGNVLEGNENNNITDTVSIGNFSSGLPPATSSQTLKSNDIRDLPLRR